MRHELWDRGEQISVREAGACWTPFIYTRRTAKKGKNIKDREQKQSWELEINKIGVIYLSHFTLEDT